MSRRFLNAARAAGVHDVVRWCGKNMIMAGFDRVNGGNGVSFRVPPVFDGVVYTALLLGRYEKPETTLMRSHFTPDHTIFDLGASIGYVSSHAFQEKLLPGGHLICVEANPDVRPCLEENMAATASALAHLSGRRYSVIDAALVAAQRDSACFAKLTNLGSHVLTGCEPAPQADIISVNAVTMGELVARHAPDGYSLICDIEGGETALFDAPDALAGCRQMMIELHPPELARQGMTVKEAVVRFEAMGFALRGQQHMSYAFTRPAP